MSRKVENKNVNTVVANNKGEQTMTNETKETKEFNALAWVKGCILQAYYKAQVEKNVPEDGVYEITMNGRFQGGIFWYLNKFNALKVVSYKTETFQNEDGQLKFRHTVYIKDLDINAKGIQKTETGYDGGEYSIFTDKQKQKAKAKVLDSLVA